MGIMEKHGIYYIISSYIGLYRVILGLYAEELKQRIGVGRIESMRACFFSPIAASSATVLTSVPLLLGTAEIPFQQLFSKGLELLVPVTHCSPPNNVGCNTEAKPQ